MANNWKRFNGTQLPESGMKYLEKHYSNGPGEPAYKPGQKKPPFYTPWASGWGGWCEAYYEGKNAETATNWIIVFNDGGYYKVDASYMVWYHNPKTGNPSNTARWTKGSLHKAIVAIKNGEMPPFDPNYQT